MLKANLVYTRQEGNILYAMPQWKALDEDGHALTSTDTKRESQMVLAWINRQVKSGRYASRPLYTGY